MAHLKTKATTNSLTEREQWKWCLIRSLYDKEYSKLEIVKLFKFIDAMMTLPVLLQQNLNQKIVKIDDLETLAEDLFDMNSIDDLQQWLSKFKVN